jgi:serine/threonine-protein kinase RsbW
MNRLTHRTLAAQASHSSTALFPNMHKRKTNAATDLANTVEIYELTTPSHTENLEMIRDFTCRLGHKAGLDDMALMDIAVAVEEACVNAIKHAHRNIAAKPLRLRIEIGNHKLAVLVRDQGHGFDPDQLNERNAQELLARAKNGGRGIVMMKMLMDEVHFEAENGKGTQVRLVRFLASRQSKNIHCSRKH